MMKKKRAAPVNAWARQHIVFYPAITPMEAAMQPAKERKGFGALHHARRAFELERTQNISARRSVSGIHNRFGPARRQGQPW